MAHATQSPCPGSCGIGDAIDRRAFLSAAALASVTLALTACGDHQIGGVTGVLPPTDAGTAGLTLRLADFPALAAVGGVARVTQTGAPIAVYRSGPATYQAFAMRCPHSGTTVNITADGFLCPNHKARFAKDGTWLGGKATTALIVVPSTYDATSGTLTLSGAGTTTPPNGGGDDDDDDLRTP